MLGGRLVSLLPLLLAPLSAAQPWEPDVYPISYWLGPPDAFYCDRVVAQIAELNFTVMGNVITATPRRTREVLDLAQKHGLKAIVCDRRIRFDLSDSDDWQTAVAAVIDDYAEHPALYGYYLKDEPNRADFPLLAALEGEFSARDPAHLPYINLFPTYADTDQLGTPSYTDHVEDFLRTVTPRVLSYDHYALRTKGEDRPDYFENLEIIRAAALRHDVPFWNIILLIPHFGYRDPTEAELRWQVSTSLAYGCKGIWYFTLWTLKDWDIGPRQGGVFDADGNPTHHFEQVKRVNRELQVLGSRVLKLTSVNVYHTPTVPTGARQLGGDAPVSAAAGGELLIGWLQDAERQDHIMVVNRDYATACDAGITLKGPIRGVYELSGATGQEEPVTVPDDVPTVLHVRLDPGQGRLFRLDRNIVWAELPPVLESLPIRFRSRNDARPWRSLHSVSSPKVDDGALTFAVTGGDPYVGRARLRLSAKDCPVLVIRMRKAAGGQGQVFWTRSDSPRFSDKMYLNYETLSDGEFHDIRVPVGGHPEWRGIITALRVDPDVAGEEGAVAIESIRADSADAE